MIYSNLKIEPIASSSSGNCYKVSNRDAALLIECGITIDKLKKALNYNFSDIKGVLITHEHKDHSKSAKDLNKLGLNIYATYGTFEEIGLIGKIIKKGKIFKVGSFTIYPFETFHDCQEPCGFLIKCEITGAIILFATDTRYIKNRFKGVTNLMVECNYSEEALEMAIKENRTDLSRIRRLRESHFSLENLKEFIKCNDFSELEEVYLLHLSDENSDEEKFKKEIQKLTGVPVEVCKK